MSLTDRQSAQSMKSVEDLRATPRFALLLRAAKLVGPNGEYLCIVRDISETGVRLRLFHSLAGLRHLALESATGECFGVDLVWERDGEAGFRFIQPIDVHRFIAEVAPHPKRPIRVAVDSPVRITVAGTITPARLCNLSRQGARIETDVHLAIGQQLRIDGDELPTFEATICWRDQPAYGMVFHQVMSLDELAQRVFRMQPQL